MNYESLEELYSMFHPLGLEILAFPCNQFGEQEPDSAEDVQKHVQEDYGVEFPILEKVEVKGEDAHPLFVWL